MAMSQASDPAFGSVHDKGTKTSKKPLTGSDWSNAIWFYPEAEKKNSSCRLNIITEDELMATLKPIVGVNEKIENIWVYKVPLNKQQLTFLLLYHEFLVFETKCWWWSIEKHPDAITIQRSTEASFVKDYFRRKRRIKGRARLQKSECSGSIYSLFTWIKDNGELRKEYNVATSNCKHFAEAVFKHVAISHDAKSRHLFVKSKPKSLRWPGSFTSKCGNDMPSGKGNDTNPDVQSIPARDGGDKRTQQMTFDCWFAGCGMVLTSIYQLKKHSSNHGFLREICPWCRDVEKSYRRMVDLKLHVRECHVRELADDEKYHFLRERCGFFLAINPDDYRRVIGTPEEGLASDYLKTAIRSWCAKNPRGRSLMDWEKGWQSARSHSQTKPHDNTIVSVTMTKSKVLAVLWVEDGDYRRVTLSSTVIGQPWKCEAIFRRMAVAHTPSDLSPCLNNWTSCEEVPTDRLARCLGVDVDDIVLIEAPLTFDAQRSPSPYPVSPLPESPKVTLHSPQKSPPRNVQIRDSYLSLSAFSAPSQSRKLRSPTKSSSRSTPTYQQKSRVEVIPSADGQQSPLNSLPRLLQTPPSTAKQPLKPYGQLKRPSTIPSTYSVSSMSIVKSPAQKTPVIQVLPSSPPVSQRRLLMHPSPGSVSSRVSQDAHSQIKDSAMVLLRSGGMPLFPPGRRDWTLATPVALPVTGPLSAWPPADWQQMSPEDKLMAWEATCYTLGASFSFPLSRSYLLDAFQCLELPGSRNPSINSHEAQMRHFNYMALRNIAVGETPNESCDSAIVTSFQAATSLSMSKVEGPYKTFIASLEDIPLRLQSSEY